MQADVRLRQDRHGEVQEEVALPAFGAAEQFAAVGVDLRRFRANVNVDGVEGLTERDWVGREIRLGDAVVGVRQVRGRCVMTTFDPDTLEQDISGLQKIYRELDGRTALDCYVLQPGRVSVGDAVGLSDWWTLPHAGVGS